MSLYELMYHIFALSLSRAPTRRVYFASGTSASSMYSFTLKAQAVTVAIEVSFPSNLSGSVILIDSGILDDCFGSDGVSRSVSVSDSACLWGSVGSVCIWSTSGSIRLWGWGASAASGVMLRARNSLARGILAGSDR